MGTLLYLPLLTAAQPPVYRCDSGGKVTYTDTPCLGGQAIDATPTQGLNSMTGQRKPSAEVRRSEHQRQIAEAFYPLTRMSPEQLARESRRHRLLPEARVECRILDARLPDLTQQVQQPAAPHQATAEKRLYEARQRYHALHC